MRFENLVMGGVYRITRNNPYGATIYVDDLVRVVMLDYACGHKLVGVNIVESEYRTPYSRSYNGIKFDWWMRAEFMEPTFVGFAPSGGTSPLLEPDEQVDTFALLARTERGRF